jgi:glycosyltransferase involved in cell wall biosynthesis
MNPLRVALVTPRFWPLSGGPEDTLAELALGLKRRGAEPRVITARWETHWSPQLVYGLVPVVRLPHPRTRSWGTLRYLIALARWLRSHRGEFDLVYLVGTGHEASVARSALRGSGIPIVVRPEIVDSCGGKRPSPWRLGRRCSAADAAIVGDLGAARMLAAAGLSPALIHLIPDGVPDATSQLVGDRSEARAALAEVNLTLTVPAESRIVVCVGRLCKGRGLLRLLEAWRPLAQHWPGTRLWLVGDGPFREPLYARLGDLDLRLAVSMPGSFDELGDVLAAADLLVEPSGESLSPRVMLQAACLGRPVVGCNLETLRQTPLLDAGTARFTSPDDASDLSRTIAEMLDDPPSAARLAVARQRVLQEYSSSRMIEEHLRLFERLRG